MTKREAVRWIKKEIARELRGAVSEAPQRSDDAPDPKLVSDMWQDVVWDIAERIHPEHG